MDNPAAILSDDVTDWDTTCSFQSQHHGAHTNANAIGNRTTNTSYNQQKSPQQHYRRNVSTYSLDLPATMGLMTTSNSISPNNGSTTSST